MSISAQLRWPYIRSAIRRVHPETIVEVGCGKGALAVRIAPGRVYRGYEPDGVSFEAASHAVRAISNSEIRNEPIPSFPDSKFHALIACEVLEHLEDDNGALATWRDWLHDDGLLVISVPAFQERFGPWDEKAGHYRRYAPEQLAKQLADAGFVVEHVQVWGMPTGYALEGVRNLVARRSSTRGSMTERTSESGRLLQPPRFGGVLVGAVAWPARGAQRLFRSSGRGIGLVAVARRQAR